jgi:hypothetical protein
MKMRNKNLVCLIIAILIGFNAAFAQEDSLSRKIASAQTLAEFPVNTFLENLAVNTNGNLFVTSHLEGKIYRITPNGEKTVFAEIKGKPAGIAFGENGELVVTGFGENDSANVFLISRTGKVIATSKIEGAIFLNGIVRIKKNRYLIADSYRGAIWEFNSKTKEYKIWSEAEEFKRADEKDQTPGLNGVRIFNDELYVTNTQQRKLFKIKLDKKGGASGKPELFAANLNGDDFAIDEAGNLYVTTHIFNSVVRVAPDGTKTVVAEAGEGVTGSTALAFGRSKTDKKSIYVVTNGGMSLPPKEGVQTAKIVRLNFATSTIESGSKL